MKRQNGLVCGVGISDNGKYKKWVKKWQINIKSNSQNFHKSYMMQ